MDFKDLIAHQKALQLSMDIHKISKENYQKIYSETQEIGKLVNYMI